MLRCYFDASYDSPATATVVSGWVATSVVWERFDADWRILLARYDVPYFHMREFAHSVGPFVAWKGDENKRANFLRNAVDIIRSCAFHGFACHVDHATFSNVDNRYFLSEWVGGPYALASRDCVAHANKWLEKERRELDVDYFFEAGDVDAGDLKRVMKKDKQPAPKFAPGRNTVAGDIGLTPLQAADFAAYELLKAHRIGENLPLHKYRRSLRELAKIPASWGTYTESDLIDLCVRVQIPQRTAVRAATNAVQA